MVITGYLLINKKFKKCAIYINNWEFLTFSQILRGRGYSKLHTKICVHCDMEEMCEFVF